MRLSLPLIEPEDVIRHLGKGVLHWKAGRSAHALATRWHSSADIPPVVRRVLDTSEKFSGAQFVDGFLERSVDLGNGGRPSQTDLLAILRLKDQLAVAAVEGKVDESFGPLVGEWLKENPGRKNRLAMLCGMFGLGDCDEGLRYQLFHRSASAILEAERYHAPTALLLIHSFSLEKAGFADYAAFLEAIGMARAPVAGRIYGPLKCRNVEFHAGWVVDDCADISGEKNFWRRLEVHALAARDYAEEILDWIKRRSGKVA